MRDVEFFDPATEIGRKRLQSGELDFGVWWKDANGFAHRVSLITDTGEVYAFNFRQMTVEILAEGAGSWAEKAMEGWAEVCGEDGSLDWARQRLRAPVSA